MGNKIIERSIIHRTDSHEDYMITSIRHIFLHNQHQSSIVIAYSVTAPNIFKLVNYLPEKGLSDGLHIWEVVSDHDMAHSEK